MLVPEGSSGTTLATFTITLSAASGKTVSVSASTSTIPSGAVSPSDFAAKGPIVLTFAPGQTTKTFTVTVKGDTTPEQDEDFNVILSGEVNATLADDTGKATIVSDDAPPPPTDEASLSDEFTTSSVDVLAALHTVSAPSVEAGALAVRR